MHSSGSTPTASLPRPAPSSPDMPASLANDATHPLELT